MAAADYRLLPLNAIVEGEPYRQIQATTWGSQYRWSAAYGIEITAFWGWPAVPDAIVTATIELTAILRLESPRATNRINELDQVVSTSRAAQNILGELLHVYNRYPVVVG